VLARAAVPIRRGSSRALRAESGSFRPMNLPLRSNADLSDEGSASGGGASGGCASGDGGDGGGREGDGGELSGLEVCQYVPCRPRAPGAACPALTGPVWQSHCVNVVAYFNKLSNKVSTFEYKA